MGKKIFVSYKYSDSLVQNLPNNAFTTARHYVDELQTLLTDEDHIYKGENDGEDLSQFKDEQISSKLKGKIFDSTVTIVMVSKGMKDYGLSEDDQWIPWEVAYSLKELSRDGRYSKTNAVLAVVLPDENGSYNYFLTYNAACNSTNYNIYFLFEILRKNMFNRKKPDTRNCNGNTIYNGRFSYIHCVTWAALKNDLDDCINAALEIQSNGDEYDIVKIVA